MFDNGNTFPNGRTLAVNLFELYFSLSACFFVSTCLSRSVFSHRFQRVISLSTFTCYLSIGLSLSISPSFISIPLFYLSFSLYFFSFYMSLFLFVIRFLAVSFFPFVSLFLSLSLSLSLHLPFSICISLYISFSLSYCCYSLNFPEI
jgi:hypothetical protein